MITIIKAIILIPIYILMYFLSGALITKIAKFDHNNTSFLLLGFGGYYSLFFIVMLPCKLLVLPLKMLPILWISIMLIVLIWNLIFNRDILNAHIHYQFDLICSHKPAVAFAIITCVLFIIFTQNVSLLGSPWDYSYYMGEISQDIRVGYSGITDPYTGERLYSFSSYYVFETWMMHTEIMCLITKLAGMTEVRITWYAVAIILYNKILWELSKTLFKKVSLKVPAFMFIVFVLQLLSLFNNTPGHFLLVRGFEGKAMFANIILPGVFLCFMNVYRKTERSWWLTMFLLIFMSFSFCMSAIFILPVYVGCMGVALLVHRFDSTTLLRLCGCMLPGMVMALIYFLINKGIVTLYII